MKTLFRDVEGGLLCPQGSVACIGAFDGLHLGHQALLRHAADRARALRLPMVALGFEPLPREVFAHPVPARLMLPRPKACGLFDSGAGVVGLLRFNAAFAAMSAERFVRQLLVERLRVREVWVGPDFRFGSRRGGDLATLRRLGRASGFDAGQIEPVLRDGERVSSTRIRAALAAGDLALAARLLGRPYAIGGHVLHGTQLGRKLGFPTANLRFDRKRPPMSGVFAARVRGVGDAPWPAVASFGTRPTIGGHEPLLEAHLFDFDGDLYGRRIEVEFVAKLREEAKFDDLPAMVAQMTLDAAQARSILDKETQ